MTDTLEVASPPQPLTTPDQPRERRWARLSGARFDRTVTPYLLVSPYFVLFAVFGLFPLGFTLWVSLHRWQLAGEKTWVGLDNYEFLVTYDKFWNSIGNTVAMFVVATVPQLLAALFIANALNKRLRARLAWRLAVLAPMVTSVVAVAIVFNQLFSLEFGTINWALESVGVNPIDWRADKLPAWVAISVMVDWRWTGYNAIIFLAAMQVIPRDLYEAAAIDGASSRRQFWSITVPMLKPVIIFTVFISTIGGLLLFAEPMIFGRATGFSGGSANQFQTAAMFIVELFRTRNNYGMAAAAAWLLFLLILLVAVVNYLVVNRIRGAK